jgi:hypothetical protein
MCVLLLNIIRPYIGINISVNGKAATFHVYLNSKLDGCEWSATHPGRFNRGERLPVILDRRLDGIKSWFLRGGEEKMIHSLVYRTSVMQLAVLLAEQSRGYRVTKRNSFDNVDA